MVFKKNFAYIWMFSCQTHSIAHAFCVRIFYDLLYSNLLKLIKIDKEDKNICNFLEYLNTDVYFCMSKKNKLTNLTTMCITATQHLLYTKNTTVATQMVVLLAFSFNHQLT